MFNVQEIRFYLLAVCCLALTGCQSVPWMRTATNDPPKSPMADLPMALGREGSSLATPDVTQAASFSDPNSLVSNGGSITPLSGQELAHTDEVLRELNAIGAVDPVAAQQLVERLQDTKPSLRPLVARQFRTSWQYHRERFGDMGDTAVAQQSDVSVQHVAQLPPPTSSTTSTSTNNSTTTTAAEGQPPANYVPGVVPPATAGSETSPPANPNIQPPALPEEPQASVEAAKPMQDSQVLQAVHAEAPQDEEIVDTPRSWQDVLGETTDKLAADVSNDPRSTEEAYEHVRLRLMQLVAGDKEAALEPIPGLTPTEQSYWKNQLFAIATLIDHQALPDEEARAALAAEQLAEAAARLGELSSLAVRNLTFCQKVYGYGDFDKPPQEGYKPAQQVTLYAEVDNFRSESTDKGYHTSLATSYEVLDQAGNRVEGGEFATVEDLAIQQNPEELLLKQDVCNMEGVASESIDLAFSRAVMEHVNNPRAAFHEIYRVLNYGGKYIFLTPGSYDYATIISKLIPNKLHAKIVKYAEGREESDTFPAYYRSNSKKAITKYANEFGFRVTMLSYISQYPSYLTFSRPLFWAGCAYEKIVSRFESLHFLRGWILAVLEKPRLER